MSVYRDRRTAAGGGCSCSVAALLVGALIGFLVARATEDEPTLAEQVEGVQSDLAPAIGALALVPDHYRQRGSRRRVVEPAQYEAPAPGRRRPSDTVAAAAPSSR